MEEQKELLQIAATIENVSSRADRTWKLSVGTQELTEEQALAIVRLARKVGWLVFKETGIEESDIVNIPEIVPEFKGDKSPQQRLRDRMFRYHEKTKGTKKGFDTWYVSTIDEIGQTYLDRMEKEDEK